MVIKDYFSGSYVQARERFTRAARAGGFEVKQIVHPTAVGPDNGSLSIDLAIYAPAGARSLLIITSGTHGVEGFCGSGCQVGLLQDAAFIAEAQRRGVALLMIHGVNPYGFAHLRRVNEDNVDLNRNSADFSTAADTNPGYVELDPLLLPESWPPDAANQAALALTSTRMASKRCAKPCRRDSTLCRTGCSTAGRKRAGARRPFTRSCARTLAAIAGLRGSIFTRGWARMVTVKRSS